MKVRLYLFLVLCCTACNEPNPKAGSLNDISGNDEVEAYLRSFEGRGALTDNSTPTSPEQALSAFVLPEDLRIDLVLSEPQVNQPLELVFDQRGRLWVVQYNQYPYPSGLKVTGIDNHLRSQFDKIPQPPPQGASGADRITFFTDTDGDGTFDLSTEAISGLNIATGVAFGRGNIWVLNPPYLLAYPDRQQDGLPDAQPRVHLRGFGMEDTHAVANSLRWGPDGWLYGATGSTVTSNISSSVTKNVKFEGQAIWRYHPETEVFEIFAEGGGNTFHVEFDSKGRLYSGDNGANTRGQYYKQGAYYQKNWGKHGALTNPFAFGYLDNMKFDGEPARFTHAWIKYEGSTLPSAYHQQIIAINPLLNYLQLSEITANGSTFKTADVKKILETKDHWFRPVDIKAGPDGAIYLADWYDSRLSHIDPHDTWHKTSGRVYRLRNKDFVPSAPFDLSTYSLEQLISLLSHQNKWFRQQAIQLFGDRKDSSAIAPLTKLLMEQNSQSQLALEVLWALHLSGGFNDQLAELALLHPDPFVRMWAIRLIGDQRAASEQLARQLTVLASREEHPEVQSQLACSAKRLPWRIAIPVLKELIKRPGLVDDPDNPMLIWWAFESLVGKNAEGVIDLFEDPDIWRLPVTTQVLLERLAQRLVMEDQGDMLAQCTRLLRLAPDGQAAKPAIDGIQEGMRGKDISQLPQELIEVLEDYANQYQNAPLLMPIRQKNPNAINAGLEIVKNDQANLSDRLAYIQLFGELKVSRAKNVLLELMESENVRVSVRLAALHALSNFDDHDIGVKTAAAYPFQLRGDAALRLAALNLFATRPSWALQLIALIKDKKQVSADDVPVQIVQQLRVLDHPAIQNAVNKLWPETTETDNDQRQLVMAKIKSALASGNSNQGEGKVIYQQLCGGCHKLFGEGGAFGPDLTGYDRRNLNYLILNIVDPNLEIREGFVNYKIVTTDGRTMTGILADRSSKMVRLKSFGGDEIVIPQVQISVMEPQTKSIMPERLVDQLSEQQLRDLFAYIMDIAPEAFVN